MCDSCEFKMPFGKFKGEELGVIKLADKDYIQWLQENIESGPVAEAVEQVIEEHE